VAFLELWWMATSVARIAIVLGRACSVRPAFNSFARGANFVPQCFKGGLSMTSASKSHLVITALTAVVLEFVLLQPRPACGQQLVSSAPR